MILIIDNYDSFVQNLARYVREAGWPTQIVRNDACSVDVLLNMAPAAVMISPGPNAPADAGISLELVRRMPADMPFLGVCLGHQCLIEAFGGETVRAREPLHGEASDIHHDGGGIFAGLPSPTPAGRYHSLISVLPEDSEFIACAHSASGEIMAVRHRSAPWHGVQFHPESVLTPNGRSMLGNFLSLARRQVAA